MCTDELVFDPRVWNASVREYFIRMLYRIHPPIVLISAVSCAHRYALDMARSVKEYLPDTIVVLGGRHADETMTYDPVRNTVDCSYSSTVKAIVDGRVSQCVDFVVGGQAHYSLDFLMKSLAVSMNLETRVAFLPDAIANIERLGRIYPTILGRSIIVAILRDAVVAFPFLGPSYDLTELPSPYVAFAIRAHFPIFEDARARPKRTAHMATTNGCPYRCNFCSEGMGVVGRLLSYDESSVQRSVDRVLEHVHYGAEALFFDDSVLFAGSLRRMRAFARMMAKLRAEAREGRPPSTLWIHGKDELSRLADLEWGAQFTCEFFSTFMSEKDTRALLVDMRAAGCSYLYFGIESLAPSVIAKIHKHLRALDGPSWEEKTRTALRHVRDAGIRAGVSVLFGLDGETRETIDYTIDGVASLIDEGVVNIASPSLVTYHPRTELTRRHQKEGTLDYHSFPFPNREPYIFFEQAYAGLVSQSLSEDDLWHIHRRSRDRWGAVRNSVAMVALEPTEMKGP